MDNLTLRMNSLIDSLVEVVGEEYRDDIWDVLFIEVHPIFKEYAYVNGCKYGLQEGWEDE